MSEKGLEREFARFSKLTRRDLKVPKCEIEGNANTGTGSKGPQERGVAVLLTRQ